MKKYGKIRVRETDENLILIQELKFGLFWWTILKTYSQNGALSFINFVRKEYNVKTGLYE